MSLLDRIRIAPRYQRAIRIDTDLSDPAALEGFVCTATFGRALTTLAEHVRTKRQAAFTWTGPYGGGKSSLVVALAALIGPRGRLRERARDAVGADVAATVIEIFKPGTAGWRVVPIIGSRRDPAAIVWEALLASGAVRERAQTNKRIDPTRVLEAVERVASRPSHAGLLIVIDELGKVFEHLAGTEGDLHFFQELAERASRSQGRLVIVGALHQSFEEYTGRLSKNARDEWAKVQGRFVDIPLQVAGAEQLEILARAIEGDRPPKHHGETVDVIATELRTYRPDTPTPIGRELRRCWPLHPITACLLGPISRRRFAQNQRSLFAFLNSHEPAGFQEFLASAGANDVYGPDLLFDYLRLNLEPTILASPDGHRWALAVDAVERLERHRMESHHHVLLKAIALIDLFRERSGLFATVDVLQTTLPNVTNKVLRQSLDDLKRWSVVIFRDHLRAFAIYAGSDFDLHAAMESATEKVGEPDLSRLKQLTNLRSVVAKRHYHQTGALRWFEVDVVASRDVESRVTNFRPNGAAGQFLLVVPAPNESAKCVRDAAAQALGQARAPCALGLCRSGHRLLDLARDLLTLEHVRKHRPELGGDPVARREVDAQVAHVASELDAEVRNTFASAAWNVDGKLVEISGLAGLSRLASDLADSTYIHSPRIHNELLNRSSPSSNAIAAQKALLKAMVAQPMHPRLGIAGFPAEGGLYESLLASTGLHGGTQDRLGFRAPARADPGRLRPLWMATDELLKQAAHAPISASQVYALWTAPPFGVREGLRPVLFAAYLLSRLDRYTVYVNGQLEVALTDVTIDRFTLDPGALSLRVFDAGARERALFEGMRQILQSMNGDSSEPLDGALSLARRIVAIVKSQPPFAQRTSRLSASALAIRAAIRAANDPHTLLHESLPKTLSEIHHEVDTPVAMFIGTLRDALNEITLVYRNTLEELDSIVRRELGLTAGVGVFEELHGRAECIQGLTGDFRLEAFVTRLRLYGGTLADMEGIASLAANKPPRDWSDNDFDRACMEVAELAQRFNRAEAFARVRGREDGRHAVAFVVGLDRFPELVSREFEIPERDRGAVLRLARDIKTLMQAADGRVEILLAALAQVGSDVLNGQESWHQVSAVTKRGGRHAS
jgi:hypothetical protein